MHNDEVPEEDVVRLCNLFTTGDDDHDATDAAVEKICCGLHPRGQALGLNLCWHLIWSDRVFFFFTCVCPCVLRAWKRFGGCWRAWFGIIVQAFLCAALEMALVANRLAEPVWGTVCRLSVEDQCGMQPHGKYGTARTSLSGPDMGATRDPPIFFRYQCQQKKSPFS